MVVVFGSINLDLVSRVERFPGPGETLAGSSFATYPGGKGANQALAAARAGAKVRLYGAVGRDAFADAAMRLLLAGGVDLRGVARVDAPTGCATILVTASGENCIVVVAGANGHADPASIPDDVLTREAVLVLQQEVPAAANEAIIRRAHAKGARIVLNAGEDRQDRRPVSARSPFAGCDVLIVSKTEAVAVAAPLGWPAPNPPRVRQAVGSAPFAKRDPSRDTRIRSAFTGSGARTATVAHDLSSRGARAWRSHAAGPEVPTAGVHSV
jgi:ribokinase